MYYAMLVTVGEDKTRQNKFRKIVRDHYKGLGDFFDYRGPYVMIERIPYGNTYASYKPLQDDLTKNGFTVWVVIEPISIYSSEIVYSRSTNFTNGILKLQHFVELPPRIN